jgi:hypothetical protein
MPPSSAHVPSPPCRIPTQESQDNGSAVTDTNTNTITINSDWFMQGRSHELDIPKEWRSQVDITTVLEHDDEDRESETKPTDAAKADDSSGTLGQTASDTIEVD